MFGMTTGLVLFADPTKEPEPIILSEDDSLQVLQKCVGGLIDTVKVSAMNAENDEQMVLVGYVNDEGLLQKLPLNPLASVVFNRELVGDVVLVSGTNPESGAYDGENYDLPMEFINYIMHIYPQIIRGMQFSKGLAAAVAIAYRSGVITKDDLDYVRNHADEARENEVYTQSVDELPDRFKEIVTKSLNYVQEMLGGSGDE